MEIFATLIKMSGDDLWPPDISNFAFLHWLHHIKPSEREKGWWWTGEMSWDQELVSEEAFCTLGEIQVVKENFFFVLILTNGGSGRNPVFKIHLLKDEGAGSASTLFLWDKQNASKRAQTDERVVRARVVFKYNGPASPFRLMKVLSLANFTLNIEAGKLI